MQPKTIEEKRAANAASQRRYYASNKVTVAERYRRWAAENKCRLDEKKAAWRKANPDRAKKHQADWLSRNLEHERARKREFDRGRPVEKLLRVRKRQVAKVSATPSWANPEKIAAIYAEARAMRERGLDVQVDHVVPLQGKFVCGLHVENNLQIIGRVANASKANTFEDN